MSGSPVVPDVPGLPPRSERRTCRGECRMELPATSEYYLGSGSDPQGLSEVCRACANGAKQRKRARSANAKRQVLEQALQAAIDTSAALVARGESDRVPHYSELMTAMSRIFGGAEGIAAHMAATYRAAKPGSMVRQRILTQIVAMIGTGSEQGLVRKPANAMSDEEVNSEIQSLMSIQIARGIAIEGKVREEQVSDT